MELSSRTCNNVELRKASLKRLKDKTCFSLAVYVAWHGFQFHIFFGQRPGLKSVGSTGLPHQGQSFCNMRCKSFLKVAKHFVAGLFQEPSLGTSLQNVLARLVTPNVEHILCMPAAMAVNRNASDKKPRLEEGKGRPRRD